VAVRAGVSVVLFFGFYLLVLLYVGGLPFGASWLVYTISGGNVVVLVAAGLGIGLVVGGLVVSLAPLREEPFVPRGVPLYRDDAPELWRAVEDVAARVGTRPPARMWLTGSVGVSAFEQTRLLGLVAGRRYLLIGLPALLGLSQGELRAALAHEHGHFVRQHSRLRALSYRTHVRIGRVVGRFASRRLNPLSWLFRGYAAVFLLVERAVSRQHELEADQVMGRIAGRGHAQAVLRSLRVLGGAWHSYLHDYVYGGLDAGLAPRDVFGGFSLLLDAKRDRLVADYGTDRTVVSRWDTHPAIDERLWALESAPDVVACADDGGPAVDLLAEPAALATGLDAACFEFADMGRLPWEDYLREVWLAELGPLADAAYRAIARATGEQPGSLEALLKLCATGEGEHDAEDSGEDGLARVGEANLPTGGVAAAIWTAAYQAGAIRFEHSWHEPPGIVGTNGNAVDIGPILDGIAEATPDGADRARRALADLGIDPTTATGGQAQAPASAARIIGAIAHVKLDDKVNYLFITDLGLLFVPCADTSDNGKSTLLRLAGERPGELSNRPGAIWLPYEEFVEVAIQRAVPIKATVRLHTGVEHRIAAIYTGYSHGRSHQTVQTVLRQHL
jgi:Zn-dependent protease with chaperone function